MSISKETLMAYVDGELSDEERNVVEAAMALDAELAHEVERQQALRQQLQVAFSGVLQEPVPDRLIATARTAPTGKPAVAFQPNVTDLSQVRAAKPEATTRRWALPEWSAMAACLVIGLFVGHQLMRTPSSEPVVTQDGRLVASGALSQALSTQVAGEASAANGVHIALTFRDGGGNYCRTFVMKEGGTLAGLACRQDNQWQLESLAQNSKQTTEGGGYRMAAGELPPSVLQAVQERIQGDPLDAAGEAAARERHWR